jgi:hypothetical protein
MEPRVDVAVNGRLDNVKSKIVCFSNGRSWWISRRVQRIIFEVKNAEPFVMIADPIQMII